MYTNWHGLQIVQDQASMLSTAQQRIQALQQELAARSSQVQDLQVRWGETLAQKQERVVNVEHGT